MPQARNESELEKILKEPLQKATDYVVQKIWNENKEVVRIIVYEAYQPKEYNRSKGFLNAWNYTTGSHNVKSGSIATSSFYYNPNSMSVGSVDYNSPDYAQHIGVGSKYYGDDARAYLADIIYGAIAWGGYFGNGPWQKQRDAWKELNDRVGKRKIKQWMKEGMEYAGLTVQMHTAKIQVTETD